MPFELKFPRRVDEASFESFLKKTATIPLQGKTLILELGPVETMDLYGMLSLLELGRQLRERGHRVLLHQPISADLQRHLERAGFFSRAQPICTVYPPYRKAAAPFQKDKEDFLLQITPITSREDRARAEGQLKEKMVGKGEAVIATFSALLTDLVDRGGAGGYAAVQSDSSGFMIAASDRAELPWFPRGDGPGPIETGLPGGLAKVTMTFLPRRP